jgi:integrase
MSTRTTMQHRVEVYLRARRALGFDLTIAGKQLLNFAQFAEQSAHRGPLTSELAIAWARSALNGTPITWARRIELIVPFARYWQQFEPTTQVPSRLLFGSPHRRLAPHIYRAAELRALLRAAHALPPPGGLRSWTYATLFGLIAAAGLRLSEALKLRRGDVDLVRGILSVRQTKFRKSRLVPLHPSTTRALRRYAKLRDAAVPNAPSDAFLVSCRGQALNVSTVHCTFGRLRAKLGWTARGEHRYPRIHDLRHTFVCERVMRWYRQGVNVGNAMAALSTYIGHGKVSDTYWYLTATPELMRHSAQRFARFARSTRHD